MKIKIANKVFEIHFLFEKEYVPFFASYIVEEDEPEYYIYQTTYEEKSDKGYLKISSKNYDLYEYEGIDIHYHKTETDDYVGKIIYGDKFEFSSKDLHDVNLNVILIQYLITRILMDNLDCVLIKGSAFSYNSKGLLVVSPNEDDSFEYSKIWNENYETVYINGYINFLILEDGKLVLYGNPWSSNINIDNNIIVKLTSVLFLYKDEVNQYQKLEPTEAFLKVTNQIVTPQNERGLEVMNKVIDGLVKLDNYIVYSKIDKESIDGIKNIIDCL